MLFSTIKQLTDANQSHEEDVSFDPEVKEMSSSIEKIIALSGQSMQTLIPHLQEKIHEILKIKHEYLRYK